MADMQELQAKLAVLKQTYAVQLPAKLVEIETLWESLQKNWQLDSLHTLHRLVHSLTGSGKTFGFPELSDAARRLEIVLKDLAQTAQIPEQVKLDEIVVLLRDVRSAAAL